MQTGTIPLPPPNSSSFREYAYRRSQNPSADNGYFRKSWDNAGLPCLQNIGLNYHTCSSVPEGFTANVKYVKFVEVMRDKVLLLEMHNLPDH
jgi:hypothetical protein